MIEPRSILIITSCTSLKNDGGHEKLIAERLYDGEQHRRLMRGVNAYRQASTGFKIDLRILSAGYGLVDGNWPLSPYDTSFADLKKSEIDEKAAALDIPVDVAEVLSRDHALVILLLGDDYMRAASINSDSKFASPTIAFGGNQLALRLGDVSNLKIVAAGKDQARRFSCGLVGLKGELAGRLLEQMAFQVELINEVVDPGFDVLDLIDFASQQTLEISA